MTRDHTDDIEKQLQKQEGMYEEGDIDDNFRNQNPDDVLKAFTGEAPQDGDDIGFLRKQMDGDEEDRGNIPPDGSQVDEDEK